MLDRAAERFGLGPQTLTADSACGSAENLAWLVKQRGIEPHSPVFDKSDRTDGTFTTQPNAEDPAQTDTLWNPGTAGVAGLAPLEDPGSPDARLDLLFRERAAWLFLTGHRQGDLRRLVRHYGRSAESTYPTGFYWQGGRYGPHVELPIPPSERTYNPRFTGCLSRGA